MKATDLMIGDLVRVAKEGLCISKDTVVEIRGIDAESRLLEKGLVGHASCVPLDKELGGGIWLDYLEPIPLTKEILEKNGFVNDSYYSECLADGIFVDVQIYAYREENILIDWDGSSLSVVNDLGHPCEEIAMHEPVFVHDLQHALRLCGIEKQIVL